MMNEMGTAAGTAFGISTNGSFDCWLQAFLTSYFPYCQSFWLSLTAWMLYQIIFHSKPTNLLCPKSFALCSGIPLILALLPLTTQSYGNEVDNSGWCFLKNRKNSPKLGLTMWTILHYALLYLNIISYVVVLLLARKRLGRSKLSLSGQTGCSDALSGIMDLLFQLIWYPAIIFFMIFPESIYDIHDAISNDEEEFNNNSAFIYVSHLCPIASGVLMSLAFVITNTEANAEVRALLGFAPVAEDTLPFATSQSNSTTSTNTSTASSVLGNGNAVSMSFRLNSSSTISSNHCNKSRTNTNSTSTLDEV